MKRILPVILLLLAAIAALWIGTVALQQPPRYPAAPADVDIASFEAEFRPEGTVAKADLIRDIEAMVSYTEQLHADPYRRISRETFLARAERRSAQVRSSSEEKIPMMSAYYILAELAAAVEDGHTLVFPLNWERTVGPVFPLEAASMEGRFFLRAESLPSGIPPRAEILAVNDLPLERMRTEMDSYLPATLPHFRDQRFAEFLGMWIQTYYRMPSPWRITYRAGGNTATATVAGLTWEEHSAAKRARPEFGAREISLNGRSVPVLSFDFPGWNNSAWEDFQPAVDSFFARHRDQPAIILDARRHHGGDGEWMMYVLSHLTPDLRGPLHATFRASPLYQRVVEYGFQSSYFEMRVPRFLWSFPIYRLAEQAEPYYWNARGVLESTPESDYECEWAREQPNLYDGSAGYYAGRVFLLTSAETFSAGVTLSGLFRSNGLGIIVGRETGGRTSMGSDMVPVILPGTHWMYMIPVMRLTINGEDPDRGTIPDVAVELLAEDYAAGRDADLERVGELIAEGSRP